MRPIVRDAVGIGVATGAYGLSFGALAVAAGLSVPQACALSLLMFTGASQFAFVGLIGSGGVAAVATALLLGARNGLYGLRLAPFVRPRALAAQFVIDESAAMAVRDTRGGHAARVLVDGRRGLRVLEPGDAAGRAGRRRAVGPARARPRRGRARGVPRPAGAAVARARAADGRRAGRGGGADLGAAGARRRAGAGGRRGRRRRRGGAGRQEARGGEGARAGGEARGGEAVPAGAAGRLYCGNRNAADSPGRGVA